MDPRYSRQLALPGFGADAQSALAAARVLVIGAGGLGSTVIPSLAGAGVGTIGIVDDDRVELSNLHRQTIHGTADVGRTKTQSAADSVAALNPGTTVNQVSMGMSGSASCTTCPATTNCATTSSTSSSSAPGPMARTEHVQPHPKSIADKEQT